MFVETSGVSMTEGVLAPTMIVSPTVAHHGIDARGLREPQRRSHDARLHPRKRDRDRVFARRQRRETVRARLAGDRGPRSLQLRRGDRDRRSRQRIAERLHDARERSRGLAEHRCGDKGKDTREQRCARTFCHCWPLGSGRANIARKNADEAMLHPQMHADETEMRVTAMRIGGRLAGLRIRDPGISSRISEAVSPAAKRSSNVAHANAHPAHASALPARTARGSTVIRSAI